MFINPVSRLLSGFAQAIIELVEDDNTPVTSNASINNPTYTNATSSMNAHPKATFLKEATNRNYAGNYNPPSEQNKTNYPLAKQTYQDSRSPTFPGQCLSTSSIPLENSIGDDIKRTLMNHSTTNASTLPSDHNIDAITSTIPVSDVVHDKSEESYISVHVDSERIQEELKSTDTDTDSCLTEPQISPNYCHIMDKRYSLDEYELRDVDPPLHMDYNFCSDEKSQSPPEDYLQEEMELSHAGGKEVQGNHVNMSHGGFIASETENVKYSYHGRWLLNTNNRSIFSVTEYC
ncbi:unnamed protein product [Heterobilharzia americana]|nr:unnamed protein product [Heterobilharzia americana]